MKYHFLILLSALLLILPLSHSTTSLHAEETASKYGSVGVNVDLASRYVWRGFDFGNSVSIQPTLSYSLGGFSVGLWGSYALAYELADYDEIDIFASYAISTKAGTFKPLVTDYTFPYLDAKFFDFSDDSTGSHTVEAGLAYSGPEEFPITAFFGVNVYNDGDHAPYLELGYPIILNDVSLAFFAGGTKGKCGWYGITEDEIAVLNVGITASKTIPITEKFSLPVAATFVVNPYAEKSFLIFKISL
jgi:uncharacterized protein (TIGR02001 family)